MSETQKKVETPVSLSSQFTGSANWMVGGTPFVLPTPVAAPPALGPR